MLGEKFGCADYRYGNICVLERYAIPTGRNEDTGPYRFLVAVHGKHGIVSRWYQPISTSLEKHKEKAQYWPFSLWLLAVFVFFTVLGIVKGNDDPLYKGYMMPSSFLLTLACIQYRHSSCVRCV